MHTRKQLLNEEKIFHQNHMCSKLYEANLLSAMDIKTINVELAKKNTTRETSMFKLYHQNMVNVEWSRHQLENLARKIKKLTKKVKESDEVVPFVDAYTNILLDELRDDQLSGLSLQHKRYVEMLRK